MAGYWCGDFDIFFCVVLLLGLVSSSLCVVLMVMDCKHVLRGVILQPMMLQLFLDLVSRGE